MNDRGFTGRWLGALDLTLRVYLDIAGYLAEVGIQVTVKSI
jgi:hypothetical protein